VHEPLDEERLAAELAGLSDPVLVVASAAGTLSDYLMRPDLGRRLAADAEATLAPHAGRYDVVFAIADGLSARAVQAHARPVLAGLIEKLRAKGWRWSSSATDALRSATPLRMSSARTARRS
jgi:ethanolamine ammonia-lyase small subunit